MFWKSNNTQTGLLTYFLDYYLFKTCAFSLNLLRPLSSKKTRSKITQIEKRTHQNKEKAGQSIHSCQNKVQNQCFIIKYHFDHEFDYKTYLKCKSSSGALDCLNITSVSLLGCSFIPKHGPWSLICVAIRRYMPLYVAIYRYMSLHVAICRYMSVHVHA